MLGFAGIAAWRWHDSGFLFYALTFLRDVAASWFLITRQKNQARRRFGKEDVLAYVSSAMPLTYLSATTQPSSAIFLATDILAIAGFSIATIAIFELGSAFGISPANRGRVRTGIYRRIKHPMYTGYLISEFGFTLLNPMNAAIFVCSAAFYFVRARLEDRIVSLTPAHPAPRSYS